jgi:hypothetical protein
MEQIVMNYDDTPTLYFDKPLPEHLSSSVSRGSSVALPCDSSVLAKQEVDGSL